jgi:hypothetical protein
MKPRLPILCGKELHWLYLNADAELEVDPESHDAELEDALIALGAERPLCMRAIEEWNYGEGRSPVSMTIAMLSKHVHPKILLGVGADWLEELLPIYESAPLPGKQLPKRPRQVIEVVRDYIAGKLQIANVKNMKIVMDKASGHLDAVRSRNRDKLSAICDYADRERLSQTDTLVRRLVEEQQKLNAATDVYSVGLQLIHAAAQSPDETSTSDPNFPWSFWPHDFWLYSLDAVASTYASAKTLPNDDETEMEVEEAQVLDLLRAAEGHLE